MSLNSLTQDQLYHRRAYQLHVMREEANEQAAKYVDKRCTKVGDLVVLVLRVALPAIMIVSATLPHFITGVAWFPFAAIGSMAVLIIFQTMFLEPYLFWKKKKGEAYFN